MSFEVLDSIEIYLGRIFKLMQEKVQYPDGRVARVDYLQHGGAVTIVPVDDEGNIWFVNQYRHPTGGMLFELPAGTLEEGEDPVYCAGREIREEIGMAADTLSLLGEFFVVPGYSSEYMYIYLATGLRPEKLPADAMELIEVEKHPARQVYEKLANGELRDGKTIAALALAQARIAEITNL